MTGLKSTAQNFFWYCATYHHDIHHSDRKTPPFDTGPVHFNQSRITIFQSHELYTTIAALRPKLQNAQTISAMATQRNKDNTCNL